MLQAALALAAALGTTTPAGPALMEARSRAACAADIDPLFVRQVAPPVRAGGRNPLLWWIGPARKIEAVANAPDASPACLRRLQVREGR